MSYYRNNYGLMNHQTESYNKFSNLNIFSSPNNNLNNLNGLNSINFSQNKPPSNFRAKKKISEIKKLNFATESNTNINDIIANEILTTTNRNKLINNEIVKLDHKLIESTTEDREHPLRELLKGLKGVGWFSSRFSQFPQEIYIQFNQPVFLKQINMVIHEKYIPAQIKFYTYYPEKNNEIIDNYHNVRYKYIGFIKMDTNERSQYRARESRKVYVNTKSLFLKIELGQNYRNEFNIFNQVGLMNLDFFGTYLPPLGNNQNKNKFILKHATRKDNIEEISDLALEDICGQELKDLKEKMDYNIKIENYLECKQIKSKLDKVRIYGRQIYDLENQKRIAVNNEDFDQAMDLKNLVDKMKANLKTLIHSNSAHNLSNIEINNKYSQIGINNKNNTVNTNNNNNNNNNNDSLFNNVNNTNNSNILNITQNINESIYSNSNDNINNQLTNYHIKTKTNEDNFISYDDTILPAVLKKLNNEPNKEENENGEAEKGELEDIKPSLLKEFKLIADVIGELGMRKIFSKQILWKDEGLNEFLAKIDDVLDYKVIGNIENGSTNKNKSDITNQIITQIMKLSMLLIEEKHPSVVIKTLKILQKLFEYIRLHGTKLNIDLNITDSVLSKIKRKLGDANKKVRAEAVSLYCYMLTLDFCDYNNLISELLEEELRHYDSKYIPKSPHLIIGKLEIFQSVFDDFDQAVKSKRTSQESFPTNLVMDYLIMNVNNSKSEVRKLCRLNISKFINIFGVNKIKKRLEKIEERELLKLINEIPSLEQYFPKIKMNNNNMSLSQVNNSNGSNNSIARNKSKNKERIKKIGERRHKKNVSNTNNSYDNDNKNNNKNDENNNNINNTNNNKDDKVSHKSKIKNRSNELCDYCQRKMKKDEIIANHWITDCPMFSKCEKCNMNLEVKNLHNHKINECKFKNEFKECRTCHEALTIKDFNEHLKNKCGKREGYVKCPLCHGDIIDNNKGFFQHLVKDGCPGNKKGKNK
jgi:centrosomal protein CEP104